ncbi:MAG: hypothetical protein M0T84_00635 [Betaproteobacteria bacterium]|nr:hypothetical protein [Betaproteobacteria bacterium]
MVIEDLHVKGMRANDNSARVISGVGFGMFRSQNEAIDLRDREGTRPRCKTRHERDHNAARHLKRLATATALPVASPPSNGSREGCACQSRIRSARRFGAGKENRAHFVDSRAWNVTQSCHLG